MKKKIDPNIPTELDFTPAPLDDIEAAMDEVEEIKPWLQLPDENDKQFAWFHHYLTSGPNRAVLTSYAHFAREFAGKSKKVPKEPSHVSPAWKAAVTQFDWKARARCYDAFLRSIREREFEQRRRQAQEKSWDYVDQLHQLADKMLAYPIKEATLQNTTVGEIHIEDGALVQTVVNEWIVKPVRWQLRDIPRVLEAADKLERTATAIEVDDILKDLELMSDERLIEIAEAGIKARRDQS